ncbi:MAG TPA: HAD family hydrolase [Stellaceae bacterium]|nr:HAD family hydrolase [Stellaceae bacterium]
MAARPAAFLDRDGVLNRDNDFVHRPEDFVWIEGARQAVKRLNDAGHLVFVVTNQSGVARGLFPIADVAHLHRWIDDELKHIGAHIDAFYVCPHHPTEGKGEYRIACDCRKPAPGMLLQAMRDFPVDRAASFLIGDKDRDLAAAQTAGIRGVRYAGGDLDALVRRILSGAA